MLLSNYCSVGKERTDCNMHVCQAKNISKYIYVYILTYRHYFLMTLVSSSLYVMYGLVHACGMAYLRV